MFLCFIVYISRMANTKYLTVNVLTSNGSRSRQRSVNLKRLGFWVYSGLTYTVSVIMLSLVTAAMFSPFGGLFYIIFLFAEFCIVLALTAFVLQHTMEFKARSIILAITVIGWLPASLLSAWIIGLAYPSTPYFPYYNFTMFFTMAAYYTLLHSAAFCAGALIGTTVRVSYAERLKREILFTASRSEGSVDLLKLAVSLKDDPLNITDGVQNLIKEGHIVGHLDNASNQLHINPPGQSATAASSMIAHSQGLAREYNIFKSLLIDLEELRRQGRITSASYDVLREEYERRLKLLESTMGESSV